MVFFSFLFRSLPFPIFFLLLLHRGNRRNIKWHAHNVNLQPNETSDIILFMLYLIRYVHMIFGSSHTADQYERASEPSEGI